MNSSVAEFSITFSGQRLCLNLFFFFFLDMPKTFVFCVCWSSGSLVTYERKLCHLPPDGEIPKTLLTRLHKLSLLVEFNPIQGRMKF